jgi:hypothetical protein
MQGNSCRLPVKTIYIKGIKDPNIRIKRISREKEGRRLSQIAQIFAEKKELSQMTQINAD